MTGKNWFAVLVSIAASGSCSDTTTPESWTQAVADTISIAGENLAIVHQDTSPDFPEIIRVRVTAQVPLDKLDFRFGVTEVWASCVSDRLRSERYVENGLAAGSTREVGRPSLTFNGAFHGPASPAATEVLRGGVRLGNSFAGEYTGTLTSDTQNNVGIVYIDVNGQVQLSNFGTVTHGTIDAAGVFTSFSSSCRLNTFARSSTPSGEPLLLAGRELTGTIIDSTFRAVMGLPLESTTRWTLRLTK